MATLTAGALLARRYRLIDRIGAGGMSVIWRARDEVLDRVVAVKVLAASLAADARFRDMVRVEARSAAQLVHPHVATVHDYGETVAPDGTITAFVVMELLAGEELEARLTAGPLPWPEAVEVCAQVAEALAAAHRLGIVHRDVTPANIMMTPTGAKVLDFGIATHVGAPDEDAEGETFGTPAYVAPERLDGTPAQPATDTYSLGVLLYETLVGRVPVPADTWDDLTRALHAGVVPAPPDVPGLPPAIGALCMRCLSRDPNDRPTAHQVAAALRAPVTPVDLGLSSHQTGQIDELTPRSTGRSRRRRAVLVAGGVVGCVLAGGLLFAALKPAHDGGGSGSGGGLAQPTVAPSATTAAPVPPERSEAPSRPAPVTSPPSIGEAVSRLDQVIDEGLRAGAIREDAAVDLQNLVRQLHAADDRDGRVSQLREKVAVRAGEGAISDGYAERLDSALQGLTGR